MFLYTTKNVRLTLCHNRAGVKPYVHFLMYIRMYICMYVCTKVTSQKLYKACFLHHVYVRLENERALLSKLYSGLATPPRLHPRGLATIGRSHARLSQLLTKGVHKQPPALALALSRTHTRTQLRIQRIQKFG